MITRRATILGALVAGLFGARAANAKARHRDPLATLDTDNDGSVDLDEARKAAGAMFDKLDKDHDGTLDKQELRGRVSAKEFAAADSDKDGTLSKDEYLALVEQRFEAADPDNDGALTVMGLNTRAGRALVRLLQ